MRLKEYIHRHTEGGSRGAVVAVADWLEEEAREFHRRATDDNGLNVTAAHLLTAAKHLRDQTIEEWA